MTSTSVPERRIRRRTLAKGAAWSVPVLAMTATVPAFAAASTEVPDPPSVNWGGACATTGNGTGCSGQSKALQVPITISNPTDHDLIFQVTQARSNNGSTLPGGLNENGLVGIYVNSGSQAVCGDPIGDATSCVANPTYDGIGNVLVPANTTALNLWIAYESVGNNASSFVGEFTYRWVNPVDETCTPFGESISSSNGAIESENCKA